LDVIDNSIYSTL